MDSDLFRRRFREGVRFSVRTLRTAGALGTLKPLKPLKPFSELKKRTRERFCCAEERNFVTLGFDSAPDGVFSFAEIKQVGRYVVV